jgi:origin recognition complex subunit 6
MSIIRALCKVLKAPAAAPHVFAGVSSILKAIKETTSGAGTPSRKRARRVSAESSTTFATTSSFEEKDIPALIAVVTMYTLSKLIAAPSTEEYKALRQTAVKTLQKSVPGLNLDEGELVDSIEAFMREAQKGWLEMDWYLNIPYLGSESNSEDANSVNGNGTVHGDDDDLNVEDDEGLVTKKTSRRREKSRAGASDISVAPNRAFGTMVTDATDWLSDDRRKDYRQWKAKILKQIERVEREAEKA